MNQRKNSRANKSQPSTLPPVVRIVHQALEDMKAVDARILDVRGMTDITDFMVVASGNSDRHVKSIAERVLQAAKAHGIRPYGIEGERDGEWVLADLPDAMVHVMLPRVRAFYAIEELWDRHGNRVELAPVTAAPPARTPRRRAPRRAQS